MSETNTTCQTTSHTLADQCNAFEVIAKQLQDPYVQEGVKRLIMEKLSGEIVTEGSPEESTIIPGLTVKQIANKLMEVLKG